jgi:putative ABC transport system permease protein
VFGNYVKSAIRNLTRQKLYTAINVLGLAIGLAACLLIIGYINNELSFENCHQNRERIYRVDGLYSLGNTQVSMASIMPAVGPAVKDAFPEIERVVRIRRLWTVPIKFTDDGISEEREGLAAEPELLSIFTLPLKEGNPQTALEAPFSVVISEELAKLHFGHQSALGRTIRAKDQFDLQVTGVFKKIPANTQLRTDFVISYSTLDKIGMDTQSWTELFQDYTYVLLREGADPAEVEQKIPALLKQNLGEDKSKNSTASTPEAHLSALQLKLRAVSQRRSGLHLRLRLCGLPDFADRLRQLHKPLHGPCFSPSQGGRGKKGAGRPQVPAGQAVLKRIHPVDRGGHGIWHSAF